MASRAPRADGETQTSEDGTAEDADVVEIANEQPGTPPEAEEAHATTRDEDEYEDEEEVAEGTRNVDADVFPAGASSPPSEDKTSETLWFFESFRAAFGDADDGEENLPEPADVTDAETALEEWAEKWEREQWERRNASAPSAERGAHLEAEHGRQAEAGPRRGEGLQVARAVDAKGGEHCQQKNGGRCGE